MYLLNKRIEKLAQERNELEKSHYLLNIELSHLKSRDRIRKIAREELDMVPIIYKDVKLIIY
jgi:cell division protein FtsL